jgi:hypothetical protein
MIEKKVADRGMGLDWKGATPQDLNRWHMNKLGQGEISLM